MTDASSTKTRRDFMKQSGAALAAFPSLLIGDDATSTAATKKTLRIGFVGVGVKGSVHVGHLMRMEGVELRAVCDTIDLQCREAQEQAKRLGLRPPAIYSRGERDFERMCAEEDLDLVYTATPWEWHVPVCLAAMKNGKHAATEIPAAYTLEECWRLVETSEHTGRHLCMMENVNYMPDELVILNMVRRGLLGELIHAEGGYLHDTRQLKMNDFGDGLWLGDHHATRNGNLYPCHGFGPLAWYLNINHGDRLDFLVSMSSKARGLDLYAESHLPPDHPKRKRKYINGDVNTCLIRTVNGVSITLTHNTDSPRPYSRINLVQGVKGVIRGWPQMAVSLDTGDPHPDWEPGDKYRVQHESSMRTHAKHVHAERPGIAKDFGPILDGSVWHYGPDPEVRFGDFLEDYRLVEALRRGVAPDFDVYDAATWSSIAILSESSVADRSRPVDVPDFTKGAWKSNPPINLS